MTWSYSTGERTEVQRGHFINLYFGDFRPEWSNSQSHFGNIPVKLSGTGYFELPGDDGLSMEDWFMIG
jgi:hypothetical protein